MSRDRHTHTHGAGHPHDGGDAQGAHGHSHSHGGGHPHDGDAPGEHGHSHSHGGGHPHDGALDAHGHSHGGGHTHGGGTRVKLEAYTPREPLERGAGQGGLLFFDCFSGVAGDMTIAALVDLGVPFEVVREATAALPVAGYELAVKSLTRSGIVAAKLVVDVTEAQPHRTYGEIDAMLAGANLDRAVGSLARAMFRRLGEAEAHTHRMPLEEVHFHEVGAVDAIVDIVGAAAAIHYVGADVVVSPLPMGRGFVTAQHGILPLPAPATVTCLAGAPTYAVDVDAELVTPTGAAIVATAASRYARWPAMRPRRVGYGAGTRTLPDRPNLLRVVLGDPAGETAAEDTHVVVEANIDDITGELAAVAISALHAAGAVDAWASPITMKKGRPGLRIAALAPRAHGQAVAEAFLRETTTIGVRKHFVSRIERPRRIEHVDTRFGSIAVKVSEGDYGPPQVKPELDACVAAAREHGVPVREVIAEALARWRA